ncbi:MAG: glycoside hydrolase family 3 protein, partial [Sporomusaceae bacterium]|nr:glycoside hydrolase family 3 protein [Sporomusaceae bacterium]
MHKEKITKLIFISTLCIFLLVILLTSGFFFGCANNFTKLNNQLFHLFAPPQAAKPELTVDEQTEAILNKMSDAEKIGQLLIVGIGGTQIDANALTLIQKYHVGGIILFDRNLENFDQTKTLVSQLQQEAFKENPSLPLFICLDQEGGQVTRMKDKFTPIPAQEDLAQNGRPSAARVWAETSGAELKSLGFNVNFAPVVDLGSAYKRSYGTDPVLVEAFAREALAGYEAKEILACLKHFPGIGKAKVDPHEDLSVVEASRAELEANDLVPFQNIIRDLDNQNFLVMVSHLKYPAYDSNLPASLSKVIMEDLLRQELGYTGLIITDDLEMGAVTKLYSFAEMGYMSVNAGVDLVLVCHNFNNQITVYNS